MFGILYGLFCGAASVVKGVLDVKENSKYAEEAVSKGKDWYIDNKGRMRSIRYGGKQVSNRTVNGDQVLVLTESGKVIRNYSAEKSRELEKRNLANIGDRTAYCYEDFTTHRRKGDLEMQGYRFRDVKTREEYVIRSAYEPREDKHYYFFVRIRDRKPVRETDYQIKINGGHESEFAKLVLADPDKYINPALIHFLGHKDDIGQINEAFLGEND